MAPPSKQERVMVVQEEDVEKLVYAFANIAFDNMTSDSEKIREFTDIQHKSALLLAQDYTVKVVDDGYGFTGFICPENIVPLVVRTDARGDETAESVAHGQSTESASGATDKVSWTSGRTRFAVPVLLYDGHAFCRLATLSGPLEEHWEVIVEFFGGTNTYCAQVCSGMSGGIWAKQCKQEPKTQESSGAGQAMEVEDILQKNDQTANTTDDLRHGKLRREDILLLKKLAVPKICDLTAEEIGDHIGPHAKVERWVNYEYFSIFKLPYPGCSFFEKCKNMDYSENKLIYFWHQDFHQCCEPVPLNPIIVRFLGIDWESYGGWDFVKLTKNYLRFLLKLVFDSASGTLFHCVNGWDRTPLFISLLRLSMWADGEIHQSLSPVEMAYLTVSYDWLLFSHDLPNRVEKSEEILFFCLYMLKHIHTEEFSIVGMTEIPTDTPERKPENAAGDKEELQFNMSPNASTSSSSLSIFGADEPPRYVGPPSNSEEEYPRPWSPPEPRPRNPALRSPTKSGTGYPMTPVKIAQAAACGEPSGEPSTASLSPMQHHPSGGASFNDGSALSVDEPGSAADSSSDMDVELVSRKRRRPTGSADESLSTTDGSLSKDELLQRRRERLTEVHRLVSSAYRRILVDRRNKVSRASYWAGSLFSEASGYTSQ